MGTRTSRNHRVLAAAAAVVLVLAVGTGCSGDDTTGPSATSVSARTAPPPSTTAAATTTIAATTTTTAATTTVPPTTTPPPTHLVVEPVVAIDGRAIHPELLRDGSFIARAETPGHPGAYAGLVRLGLDGTITQDVPAPGLLSIFDLAVAGDTVYASSYGDVCGVQPVDLTALTLGPVIAFPEQDGCGGSLTVDATDPAVLLTPEPFGRSYFRTDTRAGASTVVDLSSAVPDGYMIGDLFTLGGADFAMEYAAVDPLTNREAKAPDGSDLPLLLARVDGASGAVTAAQVGAPVRPAGGQLVARLDGDHAQVLDPVSLAATDVAASSVAIPDRQVSATPSVAWTFTADEAGVITVEQRNPLTMAIVGTVSAETGLSGRFVWWRSFAVGDDTLYVFGAQLSHRDGVPTTTHIYRVQLRPIS